MVLGIYIFLGQQILTSQYTDIADLDSNSVAGLFHNWLLVVIREKRKGVDVCTPRAEPRIVESWRHYSTLLSMNF